jgi:glycosyltransferase involved in cell wall biosynthesis
MIVSIIVPVRNEGDFVGRCLQSILAEIGERRDVEVLCVDGLSTDCTREIVAGYAARDPRIRLIDNPGKTLPKALNLGIRNARGRYILRMDAHSECLPGYVWKNIEVIQRTGAESVGGCIVTRPADDTPVGRAVAAALSSAFGVGDTRSRTGSAQEQESDEAVFGCFARDLFDRIGYFDERLTRNQDMEFFSRIRQRGGRIIISPEIGVLYYSRSTYGGLRSQAFTNGQWAAYTIWLIGGGLRPRHLVPFMFVLSLLALSVLGFFWWPFWLLWAAEMFVYLATGMVMAVKAAGPANTSAFLVLLAFIQLHVCYGVGTLWGFVELPLKFGLSRGRGAAATNGPKKT